MFILAGLVLIVSVLANPISALAEITQAFPTKNKIALKKEGMAVEIKNITVYTIHDKNFFKLRDVALLVGFNVGWDASTRKIKLNLFEDYNNSVSQEDEIQEETSAFSMEQDIEVNGVIVTLSGYNINGYQYFSIRDLAEIADFECTWNKESNLVSLSKDFYEGGNQEDIENLNEIVKQYVDEERKQKIIEENDVRYVAGSKDYDEIERFIVNNINPEFNLKDFLIEEYSPLGDVVVDATNSESIATHIPLNMLDIRYYVGEYRTSFGYQVTVIHGRAKLVDYVGEWNKNFHLDEIRFPTISDEELEQKAAQYYPGLEIMDYSIVRTFDMETLTFEAAVSVSFISKEGYHVKKLHNFTL